jgi:hypothetical protein
VRGEMGGGEVARGELEEGGACVEEMDDVLV